MRRCGLTVLAAFALAACTTSDKEPDPNIMPTAYKEEIIQTLTKTLDDPTNVRDAFISEPVLADAGKDKRYIVCVRYNARNGAAHYAGSVDRIAYFYAGHLNQLVDATPEQCGKAAYKPFPELEKLCQAKKCV